VNPALPTFVKIGLPVTSTDSALGLGASSFKKEDAMKPKYVIPFLMLSAVVSRMAAAQSTGGADIPHMAKQGNVTQLIVDGQPYLALAGEVGNSSSSSLEYMKSVWPRLAAAHVNTVLVPVSWEIIEPEEGKLDFSLVDGLIKDARDNNLRVGLLWFGSWKNLVSSYAPVWVRGNPERFPCAIDKAGNRLPILSTFSDAGCKADSKVFAALMKHIKETEATQPRKTVVMMQVQNEVGVEPPGDRDFSPAANEAFAKPVPQELMDVLVKQTDSLTPGLRQVWNAAGSKTSGTWEQVFGSGPSTNEIFMAWNYARYVGKVIDAGKAEYPIPMFVNAAIGRQDGKTATFPSGSPTAYVTNVWRCGAPQLDMLCPDIYFGSFTGWCEKYTAAGNPLFIPEMGGGANGIMNAMTAIVKYNAIGCSPFGIDGSAQADGPYSEGYNILSQLAPLILQNQGKGTMALTFLNGGSQKISLGRYTLNVEAGRGRGGGVPANATAPSTAPAGRGRGGAPRGAASPAAAPAAPNYLLVINVGPDEYFVAGKGAQITFSPNPPAQEVAAMASIDEGTFKDGKWVPGRRLNGDQTMLSYELSRLAAENQTGTGARIGGNSASIYQIKLMRYPASNTGGARSNE
jgi:hypothetical protein